VSKLDRIDPLTLRANPRATLGAWNRYSSVVLAAYNLHPKVFIFHPTNLAPATVCTRLRDAIRGALAFGFCSEISLPDLQRWYSEVVIKNDDTQVYLGPMDGVTALLKGETRTGSSPSSFFFDSLSFEEVWAFVLLLSTGRVAGPVTVKTPPDTSGISPRANVEMVQKEDGSLILL
jgi:hypothetical protein